MTFWRTGNNSINKFTFFIHKNVLKIKNLYH